MKKLDFLPRLESVRGIAALMVIGYHVNGQFAEAPAIGAVDASAWRLIAAFSNGIGAVVTFFALSGFVLARSLDGNSDLARFIRNRCFRLFPAAMAVVALLAALHWLFGIHVGYEASFDALNVLLNLLMIQSDINGVMWSMTVECAATPVILLSFWLFRLYGQRPLWVLIVLLFGLSYWGPYVHLLGGFTNLAPLYSFVIGVLLQLHGSKISFMRPKAMLAVGLIAIAAFVFCGAKKQTAPILMLECLSAAVVIGLIAWHPVIKLFKPLDLKPVRFYGRISYSFYLLHPLGILFAFRVIDTRAMLASGVPVSLMVAFMTLAAILITTPAAWLSWRLVEAPAIRIGRSFERAFVLLPDARTSGT